MSISAVILCRNEAANLPQCLESLRWCDEIVVVDDSSDDGSPELATTLGARVVKHRFVNFAAQRNWAMSDAGLAGDWVLHLDADEFSTVPFAEAVRTTLARASDDAVAFALCRRTLFEGKPLRYCDGFPVYIMRLVRAGTTPFESSGHGEVMIPRSVGTVDRIAEPFMHDVFSRGIADWFERHNRYSTREAEKEMSEALEVRVGDFFSRSPARRRDALRNLGRKIPLRPVARFLYQFVWKRGFVDGRRGLTYCALMAMYEGMIVVKKRESRAGRG